MAEIDWNLIVTVSISATVIIVSTVSSLLYNEKKKREFMKMERLWNLKCEKFESLVETIDGFYSTALSMALLDSLEWNEEEGDEVFEKLYTQATVLMAWNPESCKVWGLDLANLHREPTEESFQALEFQLRCVLGDRVFSITRNYSAGINNIKLHLLHPELYGLLGSLIGFFMSITKMMNEMGLSKSDVEKRYSRRFQQIERLMRRELDDTYKGENRI